MSTTAQTAVSLFSERAAAGHPPLLAPSNELSFLAITTDQAQILFQIIQENHAAISQRWSPGIWAGLSQSLSDIENAGGAYIRAKGGMPLGGASAADQ